jgi:Co/Zn/Cd efflux system component
MNDRGRALVAIILAVGLVIAISTITIGVLWEAIFRTGSSGLSENATQVLTTAFGGIIGVLGSYIGFRAGQASNSDSNGTPPQNPPES